MLRNTIFLVIASLIIGMVYFAIAYWIFGDNYREAFSGACAIAVTGFVIELFIRPRIEKKFGSRKHKDRTA